MGSFLRASAIGKDLKETWIVVNAATYFWNYNNHMVSRNKHRDIYGQLQIILDGLKRAGHVGYACTEIISIRLLWFQYVSYLSFSSVSAPLPSWFISALASLKATSNHGFRQSAPWSQSTARVCI